MKNGITVILCGALALACAVILAQAAAGSDAMTGVMAGHKMHHSGAVASSSLPAEPGQDAFGTIQEIVTLLEADPETDWSKVDIEALRQHLIDMNEVTLHAAVETKPLSNGITLFVRGDGRTLQAIKRMVPAQAKELGKIADWKVVSEDRVDGVSLTVTSASPLQVTKLRALGLIGLMVQGGHHKMHHLLIAKGESIH